MVWRKPPFTDNEQRNWDLLGDAAEGGGSGGGGLTLYGPYVAFYEKDGSISASDVGTLDISSINDPNTGDKYVTDESISYITIIQTINITSAGVSLVAYENPATGGGVKVINVTDSSISDASAEVIFYADHPLIKQ